MDPDSEENDQLLEDQEEQEDEGFEEDVQDLTIEFDRYERHIYEEMAQMPPFQRKTLVLIGAQGVGRRSLKNRLIVINPQCLGTTVPSIHPG
ncbi:hypothetical protein DPEC_G00237880 [Dallia pectoralis]|uniref:Uncharacterized protein n=1 Tax=Dallia pectoralis TaxID=75939 RepID=A0ACC2FYI9_DALPE|nr:hypothetical protein DPEC_G00237880 [Dallia pectoralis]